jgi:hypothetical protein
VGACAVTRRLLDVLVIWTLLAVGMVLTWWLR